MTIEQAIEQAMASESLRLQLRRVATHPSDREQLKTEIRAALANVAQAAAQLERERIADALDRRWEESGRDRDELPCHIVACALRDGGL